MSLDANTLVGVHNNNSEHLRSTYCMPGIVLSSFHVLTHFIPQQPYEVCSIIIPSLQMSHPEVKELAQHLTAIHSVMSSKPDSMSFTIAQFCFSHGAFPNTSNSLRLQQKPSSGCPEPSLLQQIWQALSTTQKKKHEKGFGQLPLSEHLLPFVRMRRKEWRKRECIQAAKD